MIKAFRDQPATQGDIDVVVSVVVKGFEEVNKNIATLTTKVDNLDKKVESMDLTLLDVKRRVYDLEADSAGLKQVVNHEHRIKKLEAHVFATQN